MDLGVLLVGLSAALCEALDAEMHTFVDALENVASRQSLKPAEAEIFRSVADALNRGIAVAPLYTSKPKFAVIKGGAN